MRRLFSMMSDQVQVTASQLQTWWATLSPDPHTWVPFTWVLVGLVVVVLLALLIRPPRRARGRRPELLISRGELRVAAWAAPKVVSSLKAPDRAAYELAMTVSNLSASPVQLLELAVRTNGTTAPTTAELAAVLPPHGAVSVTAELREAGGDEGVLDLFVYAPDMPPKTFRVRARLRWEPWNARYRVLPLAQRVDAVRGFGEQVQRRREASAWRRDAALRDAARQEALRQDTPWQDAGPQEPAGRAAGSAYREDGRFEPRPEFAQPRHERAESVHESAPRPVEAEPEAGFAVVRPPYLEGRYRQEPQREEPYREEPYREESRWQEPHREGLRREERYLEEPPPLVEEGSRRETAPAPTPAGESAQRRDDRRSYRPAPSDEETWPPARPAREEHRARATEPYRSARAGMGRAARAARGTDRDGAEAAGGAPAPEADPESRRESEQPRRWAIRSDPPGGEAETGSQDLPASGGEAEAPPSTSVEEGGRAEMAGVGPGAAIPARPDAEPSDAEASDVEASAAEAPAAGTEPRSPWARLQRGRGRREDARGAGGDGEDRERGDAEGEPEDEERPRPRLEFPDEF